MKTKHTLEGSREIDLKPNVNMQKILGKLSSLRRRTALPNNRIIDSGTVELGVDNIFNKLLRD